MDTTNQLSLNNQNLELKSQLLKDFLYFDSFKNVKTKGKGPDKQK